MQIDAAGEQELPGWLKFLATAGRRLHGAAPRAEHAWAHPSGAAPATQSRAQADTFNKASSELSLWLYTGMPGMYSVGLDEVAAETGISAKALQAAAKSRRLGLTNAGRDVPYYYDSTYQRLLFAGEAYTTFYTDENAYRLVTSQKPHPRLISATNVRPTELPPGQHQPFREVLQFVEETDLMYFTWLYPGDPDARYWFWDYLYGSFRPQIQIPLHVPNPAAAALPFAGEELHGFTNLYPDDEHRVYAALNGVPVGSRAGVGRPGAGGAGGGVQSVAVACRRREHPDPPQRI